MLITLVVVAVVLSFGMTELLSYSLLPEVVEVEVKPI